MIFQDQLKRKVHLSNWPPQRIISLVPSQTELLHYLGLEDQVIGITKFCIHPDQWFRQKTRIGGTKQLKIDLIRDLKPDLIIGNKEENDKSQINTLSNDFPVWMSDIYTLSDAYKMIKEVGKMVNSENKAQSLVRELQSSFSQLPDTNKKARVAYFIWRKPYMAVGQNTFIHDMIQKAGYINVFEKETRYPEIQLEDLKTQNIDYIFLSTEPYPFQSQHIADFKPFCQQAVIKIVDGELFSWYGSRLLKSVVYFNKLREELFKEI